MMSNGCLSAEGWGRRVFSVLNARRSRDNYCEEERTDWVGHGDSVQEGPASLPMGRSVEPGLSVSPVTL